MALPNDDCFAFNWFLIRLVGNDWQKVIVSVVVGGMAGVRMIGGNRMVKTVEIFRVFRRRFWVFGC